MKVDIAIYLFMEAKIEMDEVGIRRKGIREYAKTMADYLRHVADLAGILQRDGWCLEVVRNNLVGTHPDVKTAEDATKRLVSLDSGVPSGQVGFRDQVLVLLRDEQPGLLEGVDEGRVQARRLHVLDHHGLQVFLVR